MKKIFKRIINLTLFLALFVGASIISQAEEVGDRYSDVKVEYNKSAIYSEANPAIQVSIRTRLTDLDNNPVEGVTLYFKDDISEVSYVQARRTDKDGFVTFKYSYGIPIECGNDSANYTAVISRDRDFSKVVANADIKLRLQKKKDLVLYTDQIVGAHVGEKDGSVHQVPVDYELWSGEVHQGALVVGSGQWIKTVNGEFQGLSSGQYAIRAAERFDESEGVFYLASDYETFFVPRIR